MIDFSKIKAISLDLDDTLWPVWPTIGRAEETLAQWLAEKARQSSLLQGKKVISIPNPIDTKLFYPQNKTEARQQLNLAQDKQYILFAAMKISDARKGFQYFEKAIQHLTAQNPSLKDKVELLVTISTYNFD